MTTTNPADPINGAAAAQPKPPGAALATIETNNDDPSRAMNAFASSANFTAAQRIANALSQSTLVPKEYQGSIPNVLIAMEIASRIGASVFMVMQNIDIIHGRPAWRSQFLIATVNASGRFTPLRFRWEGKPGTDDWGCRAVAKDKETGDECIGSLITIGLARKEGWLTKSGSKWQTMPEQMLCYRAAAFWTRIYAPELSIGMHSADEVMDTTGAPVADVPQAVRPGDVKSLEAALMEETPVVIDPATGEVTRGNVDAKAVQS